MAVRTRDSNNPYVNNPFVRQESAGSNAFREAYDRLKAEAEARKQGIAQDYATAYQQLRGQAYTQGLGAAAQRGLSGGQAQAARQQVTAQQMGQLGTLMQGQEKALREAKAGESSIYSNALLEGQQAQEYADRQRQTAFERQMTVNNILNKKGDFAGYSKEQQIAALMSLMNYTRQQALNAVQGQQVQQQIEQERM